MPRVRDRWLTLVRPLRGSWVWQAAVLLRRSFREFFDDHCQQMAAAIAFHLLFSLFPLAIAVVGVIGVVTQDPNARQTVIDAIVKVVPLSGKGINQLNTMLTHVNHVGALGLLGIIGVIWSASGVMAAIRTALNIAWDTGQKRPFIRGKIVDLVLVACVFLVVGAALGITILASLTRHSGIHLPAELRFLHPLTGVATSAAVYVAAIALLFMTFTFLYRFVPAVPTRLRDVWPGALAAAIGFEAVQYGFSLYITYFAHFGKIYGSLGGIIAFLFFVYISSAVFLFGAEIAAEYPRLRAGVSRPGPSHAPAQPAGQQETDAQPAAGAEAGHSVPPLR